MDVYANVYARSFYQGKNPVVERAPRISIDVVAQPI